MTLLDFVAKEYTYIVAKLSKAEPIVNNRIVLERDYFKYLLERYQYMKFKDKTKIYKDLNFIIHDKNNYTMPYKDKKSNRTVRKVIINYSTYLTVRYLFETSINEGADLNETKYSL